MTAWKDKRKTMHAYDVTSGIYEERYSAEQQAKYNSALQSIKVKGKTVLDVGCGSGLFFKEVAAQARLVVGVDISKGLLLKAQAQAKVYDNVFVVQVDADHLPFRDGYFGAIFAFTMLQNMPTPVKTLFELRRVAAAEGWVVVTGLKKAFGIDRFMDVLEDSGMTVEVFTDDDSLNCYIAVLSA